MFNPLIAKVLRGIKLFFHLITGKLIKNDRKLKI